MKPFDLKKAQLGEKVIGNAFWSSKLLEAKFHRMSNGKLLINGDSVYVSLGGDATRFRKFSELRMGGV